MGVGSSAICIRAAHSGIKKMINTSKIYKMRIVFSVSENGLKRQDTFNAVRNMVLRSGLDYEPAKVNAHWPRLSVGPSVGRGQAAEREYIDIYLKTSVPVEQVREQLSKSKPQGVTILDVKRVPYALASVQQLSAAAVWRIEGNFTEYAPVQTIEEWVAAGRLEAVQQANNGMRFATDICPFVRQAHTLGENEIKLTLLSVAQKWINPLVCIYAWLGMDILGPLADLTDERFKVIREGLYWQDSAGDLHLI